MARWWILAVCCGVALGAVNALTEAEKREGWQLLFDGRSLEGWMWSREANPPAPSWGVEEGLLATTPGKGTEVYLITRDSFTDFEFDFEWRAEPKANSGVKYRFQGYWNDRESRPGAVPPSRLEPIALEYQIADDEGNPDAVSDSRHSTAALYEYWAPRKPHVAGPDAWHSGRIVARGLHIEHWLDGAKVVDLSFGDPAVTAAFNSSKRRGSSPLLLAQEKRQSPIALQIHDGRVWFRNLKIRRF